MELFFRSRTSRFSRPPNVNGSSVNLLPERWSSTRLAQDPIISGIRESLLLLASKNFNTNEKISPGKESNQFELKLMCCNCSWVDISPGIEDIELFDISSFVTS